MLDIGQAIKAELEEQERTISWLAKKLNVNRAAVYRILRKNSIDTNMLISISTILKHNFLKDISTHIDDRLFTQKDTHL